MSMHNSKSRIGFVGFGAVGLLLGILIILAIRFITYNPPTVHYHANFAVFINGQREQFKSPQYYQEVNVCALRGATPLSRVHMHDEINNVVHIHAEAVTWGEFFQNIGWSIGQNFIASPDKVNVGDDTSQVNIVLNGHNQTGLTNIASTVIKDKDQLLVSYGDISTDILTQEFKSVGNTAARYDTEKDSMACSGAEGPTTHARLSHLF
jgi:hypothetical protein